jgi:hypothetical protein
VGDGAGAFRDARRLVRGVQTSRLIGDNYPSHSKSAFPSDLPTTSDLGPIQIVNVIADEVTEPRNDGTRGCALYTVPFKLSRTPSSEWADMFVQTWNLPPRFTSMHRPGIARIHGDRVVLDGTTMDEVQKYHRNTLKLVVETVNKNYAEWVAMRNAAEQAKRDQSQRHQSKVRRIADDLKFD